MFIQGGGVPKSYRNFSLYRGLPRYQNSRGIFCHPANTKIQGVETTVWAMWFYCDPTVIVQWSYSHFNMIVLWSYRYRSVIILCDRTVIVLWSICDRSMIICDRNVILLWSFRYRTVIVLWSYYDSVIQNSILQWS